MNNRGQFSIIAALLVAIILAGTLIAVYSTIRYGSSQSQSPQTLIATDETNSAFQKALGFTVGYYGSILQVTGNQSYAYANATIYMNSALQYIASMNPSWGESIKMTSLTLRTNWFSNPSISTGKLSVVYDLQGLGIYGINYTTSCSLGLQIFNSPNSNQVCLNVTQDLTEPLTSLGQKNFAFYFYNYSTSNWQLVNPSLTPTIFTNGTYLINVPSGIDSSAYMVQVTDSRGIMAEASSYNSYNINFTFSAQSSPAPAVVELLQNGTMRWFGQGLLNTTQTRPIPPVSISSLHLCQTGSTSDLPFQVEDWASQYQIPLSMSSNYTIFSNNQMVVFEVSPSMSQLTLWWNGSDTAIQPSTAYTNTYFTADNPAAGTLTNGNITLQFSYPNSAFQIKSIVGNVSSTANFMRIDADPSTYGSGLAYIIQHGVVRDIVQEEAEWSNGAPNCPNIYSQIVFTLPANATYFTYQLRLIFINSTAARNINDVSPIKLTTSIGQLQAMTENGITNGIPNVTNGTGTFNNSTGNAHHWSQLINNVTLQGTGIMFTDSANQQLYAFDPMAGAGKFTGALYVNTSVPVIELDPVTSAGTVSFNSALDLTWYGSVVTFSGVNPIYANNGNSGLWPLVEQPPSATITPESSSATSINLSPPSGPVGTSVTVSGGGFIPNSSIIITFNGNFVATTTATAYGVIPSGTTFVIPSSTLGSYTITASDTSSNSAWANFTLTPPMETIAFQTSGISSDASNSTILTIDLVQYTYSTLPSSFSWQAGSIHTINASSTVAAGTGKQYAWASWSDGGVQTHNYTVPTSTATITANFKTQWQQAFGNSGLAGDATGNLVSFSVTGGQYSGTSPISVSGGSVWVDSGATVSYTFQNPVASSTTGKQYRLSSASGPASGYTIIGANTITGTYVIQWLQTFSSSGLSGDATGNLVSFSVAGGQYSGATSPIGISGGSIWVDNSATVNYAFVNPVTSSITGKQYSLNSVTGSTSPITISGANTLTGNYVTQYQVTFSQSGVSILAGSNTVLTVGSTNYGYNALPSNLWVNSGTTFSWVSPVSGGSGTQFILTGSSGLASPIVTSGTGAATYRTQYQVTMAGNFGSVSPATGNWYNAGSSVTVYAVSPSVGAGERYVWNGWTGSGSGSYTGTGNNTNLVTMNGPVTETASWTHQYQVTFSQTGVDSSAGSNTVLTVGSTNYAYNALPSSVYVDDGTTFSWVSPVSGGSNKQFVRTGSSGSSPISAAGTYSSTYKTVAIAKVGTDTSARGNGLTLSWSHTLVTGSNRLVVVCLGSEHNGITVSGVTYGGNAMTLAVSYESPAAGTKMLTQIWYILEANLPANGAKTVTVTATGITTGLEVHALCSEYTGVAQIAPEATNGVSQTSGNTITNTISPSANSWVISAAGAGDVGSWTHGSPQVEVLDSNGSTSCYGVAELRGASGQTSLASTYSGTVNRLVRVCASFRVEP